MSDQRLGLGSVELRRFDHDQPAVLCLGRKRRPKRQGTNLLWQIDRVRTHDRAERAATTAELRHTGRAVTRAAGALLLVHLLAGAPDVRAALGLVGPGLALGELPLHAALDDILARLETENLVRKLNRTGRLALKRCDFQFHLTRPPARPELTLPAHRRHWRGGTCQASARLSAMPSSPHRAPRSIPPWSPAPRPRRGSGRAQRLSAPRAD